MLPSGASAATAFNTPITNISYSGANPTSGPITSIETSPTSGPITSIETLPTSGASSVPSYIPSAWPISVSG